MDYTQLKEVSDLIKKTANAFQDNEKLFVTALAHRAKKVAEAYPQDPTAVGMSNFLSRRASSPKMLITKAELKEVYNSLYSTNNKFAEHFKTELNIKADADERKMIRDPKEGESLVTSTYDKISDTVLANNLASAFDNSIPYKLYSVEAAKNAKRSCTYSLNCCGVCPNKIEVVAGQEDLLICRASYNTPCGENAVFIPVEMTKESAAIPNFFLGKEGFMDITTKNLNDYLTSTSAKPLKVNAQKLLQVVAEAKNPPKALTEMEQIIMKAAAAKETPATLSSMNIIGQVVDAEIAPIADPVYEQPEEVQSIAKQITSSAGAAEFLFGKKVVDSAREQVLNAVKLAGYKPQVAIFDNTQDTIFVGVTLASQGAFKVPVKVSNGKAILQRMIVSNDGLFELTATGISEYLSNAHFDNKVAAATSQVYGMSPNEVLDIVKNAMAAHDYTAAEEALNVLKQSGDNVAFQTAFNVYKEGLKDGKAITKEACVKTCSKPIKVSNSQHMICSHTGLPLHKTFVDKDGNCQPLYRKQMSETGNGQNLSFISSKVLLGS